MPELIPSKFTNAATALGNLLLVTPNSDFGIQPQATESDVSQPPTILFHYEGEQTATLDSDITNHYVENNTAIQDQIALRPVTITTQGFIGELNDVVPPLLKPLKFAAEKLTAITAYEPQLSTTALIAYNRAFAVYQAAKSALNSVVSAFNTITGNSEKNQTKQQEFFNLFYGYWLSKTLFTVQTPWNLFPNMAIKSLRAIQGEDTRMITDFEVTFQQIRFASTTSDSASFQSRSADQASPTEDAGDQSMSETSSTSMSDNIEAQAAE